MADYKFNAVIPIGGWCRTTYQVRRYFRFNTAYPFDWLICPTDSLIRMFDDDFSHLLIPEMLNLRNDLDGVTCDHYAIQHKHDFLRSDDHKTLSNIYSQIDEIRSKYRYRINNLKRDASNGPVLFVRYDDPCVFNAHEEGSGRVHQKASYADAEQILSVLKRRFPNSKITLLAVNFDIQENNNEDIILTDDVHDYGDRSTTDYGGSDRGWDELFASAGLLRQRDAVIADERDDISSVKEGYW